MNSFIWSSYFEAGLENADDQHRQLVELINRFGDKLVKNEITNKDVEGVLQELVNYISVGVAAISREIDSIDDLLKAADDGVYLAKQAGRNRVETPQKLQIE